MEQSKSEIAARSASSLEAADIAEIVNPASVVRTADVEDEW